MKGADVIIIGGGIAGVSLAAELAGSMSVTLLEAEAMPGYHATGRSAAVYVPNYGDGPIRELTRLSRTHFDSQDGEFWPTPLLKHRGLLRLAREDGRAEYEGQATGAAGIEPLAIADAHRLFPILKPERFVEASYEDDVHDIDVDALLQGYLRKARRGGVRIETELQAAGIERNGRDWEVAAGNARYRAPILVNAAGAWADAVAMLAGLPPLGMKPRRRSVAVLPLPDELANHTGTPFVVPFPLGWYAKPHAGRLLVSAGDEDPAEPGDAFADDMVIAEGLHRFTEDTTVEINRVETNWAGLRTFSPDGYPVIGHDPAENGFFWFAGQGGFGIQTAPAMAKLGAKCLLENGLVPAALEASRATGFRRTGA
jgi:D-arginine dehydrogenase